MARQHVDRPLCVLHVIDSLANGGAEQNLLVLLRHLSPSYEHHLAWLYPDETLLPFFAPHVASTFAVGAGRNWGLLRASVRLAQRMRQVRPDVVSAKLIRAQIVARIAATIAGDIPRVSTWECVSYTREMYVELGRRGPWLRNLTWLLDAGTGFQESHFIAVSREVAEHNARVLGVAPARVTVIYNAIDPGKAVTIDSGARAALRRGLGVPAGGPLLLSVGRLVAQKDHATSIEAMTRVLRAFPDAVLAIAGSGQLREALEAKIDGLGLREHVLLLGTRSDVPGLLRAADLFVFPSRYEGLGIALMEAIAAGLPSVSSRIGTSLEIATGSTAVRYFKPGDPDDLASTLIGSLQDLPAFSAAARADAHRLRERFSPSMMAAQYDDVFRRAAGRKGAAGDSNVGPVEPSTRRIDAGLRS